MTRGIGYLTFIFLLSILTAGLLISGSIQATDASGKQQLVKTLSITDLSLCSEARYTRHPSQADLFAPFQDFPGSLEHFPTGSIISPNPIGFSSRIRIQHPIGRQN
ncbi:MAG: hypothetical protein V2I50_12775 [Desulfuromusa sp.]|jgi:hypothetical protein|nr:hypothetical protein [Desulfuromusa sp.]